MYVYRDTAVKVTVVDWLNEPATLPAVPEGWVVVSDLTYAEFKERVVKVRPPYPDAK